MGLLTGFTTILVVIACGSALAHIGVLDARSQRALGEIAFFVASPALLVVTISGIELDGAVANLVASATALAVSFGAYAVIARLRWRLDAGSVLIGSLASSYVNAGNLGLAIAAYVVGDITVVVPTLLVQVLVVQPLVLVALDRHTGRRDGGGRRGPPAGDQSAHRRRRGRPGARRLRLASAPRRRRAAPGARRRGDSADADRVRRRAPAEPAPRTRRAQPRGRDRGGAQAGLHAGRCLAGRVRAWASTGPVLLGVVMTAALPTAQNIFLHATRYREGEDVARESILVTTLCCLPVALLVALLLG